MRWNYHQLVAEEMGDPNGPDVRRDGLCQKGQGLCGGRAAVLWDIGQSGELSGGRVCRYASRHGYALVDKRLFLPEVWWTDAHAARRASATCPPS